MRKRSLHHVWTRIRPINHWYLLIISLTFLVIAVMALRQNNFKALQLRDEVVKTDQQNGDIEASLRKLRAHIYAHMNTDLSGGANTAQPVQLKYRYDRLVTAEKERVSKINERIYTDAQKHCEQAIPTGTIAGRVPCVQDYVGRHAVKEVPIPDALYKFSFQSPRWSPDLAGWSLVMSGAFFVLFIIRFLFERWLRMHLAHHQ